MANQKHFGRSEVDTKVWNNQQQRDCGTIVQIAYFLRCRIYFLRQAFNWEENCRNIELRNQLKDFAEMEQIIMNVDFNRKVRTMLTYSGLSLNILAKTMNISRQTLANRMNLELNSEMQNKILNALYFAAGPALAEDLKELETTLDYLEEQHG